MDGFWKHDKWNKADTEVHMLYDSIYMIYPEETDS